MKAVVVFLLYLAMIAAAAGGFIGLDFLRRNDLVLPRTVLGDIALGALNRQEVRNAWQERSKKYFDERLKVTALGEVKSVSLNELGVKADETQILAEVPFAGGLSNFEIFLWSIAGRRIKPPVSVDTSNVIRVMDEKFPDIPKASNARFSLQNGQIEIVESQAGLGLDIKNLLEDLKGNAAFFDNLPMFAVYEEATPQVTRSDLQQHMPQMLNKLKKIKLKSDGQKWEINFAEHPDWIAFERNSEGRILMEWSSVSFSNFVNEKLSSLEQESEGMVVWKDEQGLTQFEGHLKDGRAIDTESFLAQVNGAINDGTEEIEIPLLVVKPELKIADEFKDMGIQELISVGYTRFAGSPPNRAYNIGVGISKFNGLIVPRGSTFSFNESVGPVDGSTGYKKELVIKAEGTIPEFGGGLCQVSTTLYRAVVYAGLPIVARTAHKYAVSYYSQVGGHGLDATVYQPSPDLKFLNDTPGDILIHSYVEGNAAYFQFFGTSDGRTVSMEGPFISNRRGAPREPMIINDPKLRPGERKQVEKPHDGFDTVWYRYITKNGSTTKETILSRYQAIPAKFLVGEEVNAAGENQGITEN